MAVQLPGPGAQGTHCTAGLAGYPAQDIEGAPGEAVHAPENGTISDPHVIPWRPGFGGYTFYLHGASGADYFITHLDDAKGGPTGAVKQGETIGYLAPASRKVDIYVIHVHVGSTGYLYPACSARDCQQAGENCVAGKSPLQLAGGPPGSTPPATTGAPPEPGQKRPRPSRTAGGGPPGDLGVPGGDPSKQPPFPFTASAFANLTRALGVDLPYDLGRVRRARYAMVKVVR